MPSFERIDELLASFQVDALPHFSKTVLTSSPVLLTLHLEGGDAVPLPHVAVGTTHGAGAGSGCAPSSMIRRASSASVVAATGSAGDAAAVGDETDLPDALQHLLRQHKRAAYNLFLRWEHTGQREVPLNAFAEGVRQITGSKLTDADLVAILQCVDPVLGDDVVSDDRWRSRPIDCHRLWRRLQSSASRLASKYIQDAQVGKKGASAAAGPVSAAPAFGRSTSSFSSRLEAHEAGPPTGGGGFAPAKEAVQPVRDAEAKPVKAVPAPAPPAPPRPVQRTAPLPVQTPPSVPVSSNGNAAARPVAGGATPRDDAVSASEAAQMDQLKSALGRRLTEVQDLFEAWDEDASGSVDSAEFRAVVEALGLDFEPAVIDAVFDSYDTDGSGTIEYTEYISYSLKDALARSLSRVMDLFRKWDDDHSGAIDKKEFRNALKELGFDAPRHVVDALFEQMDKDHGGLVEFSELNAQLRQGANITLAKKLRPGAAGKIETKATSRIPLRHR